LGEGKKTVNWLGGFICSTKEDAGTLDFQENGNRGGKKNHGVGRQVLKQGGAIGKKTKKIG